MYILPMVRRGDLNCFPYNGFSPKAGNHSTKFTSHSAQVYIDISGWISSQRRY
jgi:hypothetical protein